MRSSPERRIDLNADLGEGEGEEPLYALVTSANVACGGHAGNEASMREAVDRAGRHGVVLGAHPSYPDRERFGRVSVEMTPAALAGSIALQISELERVAGLRGSRLAHVKPHGALYNDAMIRSEIAAAIAEGVAQVSSSLVLVGLAGAAALTVWSERGFDISAEGFADRAYENDGTLRPRSRSGAVLTDPMEAAAQAVRLATEGRCTTLCIHSDTPGAAAIAAAVRHGLTEAGFTVTARRPDRGHRGTA